jgi:ribosomal protein S18 acetylase RimI-like enzyme
VSREGVFRERDVRVSCAEPVAHAVSHERDGPVRLARSFHGLLLARAAADAGRMRRAEHEAPAVPIVRHDGKVAQSGRCEQRPDVESETIGDHGERQTLGRHPGRERSERGIEWAVLEGEPDQLSIVAAERGCLRDKHVAETDLPGIESAIDLGERVVPYAEPLQQIHAHVVQARGSVEVDEHGADRQHRGRVAAWEHAWVDLADRIVAAGLEGERVRAEVVEGGEVVEVAGLLVAFSNLPTPELNGTRVIREPDDPAAALEEARAVFRSRGHPFFGIEIEVGAHPRMEAAIRAAGLHRVEAWPTMAATIGLLPAEVVPTDVEIREVREETDLEAVRAVEVATFGTPPEIAEGFVGRKMLSDQRVRMFTAWVDGEPVGEASAYLLHDTVGIFGVGVVESARRRGIGAALTIRAARAFDDRTDLAWLQPSDMAQRMYEALGFLPVSQWEVWAAKR